MRKTEKLKIDEINIAATCLNARQKSLKKVETKAAYTPIRERCSEYGANKPQEGEQIKVSNGRVA